MSSLLDLLKMRLLLLWSLPNIYLSFVSVMCLYIIYRHMKFIHHPNTYHGQSYLVTELILHELSELLQLLLKVNTYQVCNPSIQFMIYETSLKHLRAKRAENKQGLKTVTALEVKYTLEMVKLESTLYNHFY